MRRIVRRIHWPGALGALTTLVGLFSLPEMQPVVARWMQLVPKEYAPLVILLGGTIQAVTKAVHSKGRG